MYYVTPLWSAGNLFARYSYLSLYVYVFFVLLAGSLSSLGGQIYGGGQRKKLGIVLGIAGGVIYLADNWLVLFVWLRGV